MSDKKTMTVVTRDVLREAKIASAILDMNLKDFVDKAIREAVVRVNQAKKNVQVKRGGK